MKKLEMLTLLITVVLSVNSVFAAAHSSLSSNICDNQTPIVPLSLVTVTLTESKEEKLPDEVLHEIIEPLTLAEQAIFSSINQYFNKWMKSTLDRKDIKYLLIINSLAGRLTEKSKKTTDDFFHFFEPILPWLPEPASDKLYILACINYDENNSCEDKLKNQAAFIAAAQLGSALAQQRLNEAAYSGTKLGFTVKTGHDYLQKRAAENDIDAQRKLNLSAKMTFLGFTNNNTQAREYLENRVKEGDLHAQQMLNEAASIGETLNFTHKTGRAYLEKRIKEDDLHAQQRLNIAAADGMLGFTVFEGRSYLNNRAAENDLHAQQLLNEAAANGTLGFTHVTENDHLETGGDYLKTGRYYLEKRAKEGDLHAQQLLNEAAVNGMLGFTHVTGRDHLEKRIKENQDTHAQQMLDEAAYTGEKLLFTPETGRKHLENRAKEDPNVQKLLNKAASTGTKLGFTAKTGRDYLEKRIKENRDIHAREMLDEAVRNKRLGFEYKTIHKYFVSQLLKGRNVSYFPGSTPFEKAIFSFNHLLKSLLS